MAQRMKIRFDTEGDFLEVAFGLWGRFPYSLGRERKYGRRAHTAQAGRGMPYHTRPFIDTGIVTTYSDCKTGRWPRIGCQAYAVAMVRWRNGLPS
jgi:hypothetical protein